MNLQNKIAVVTGAGGGIGRQLVLQLLERGAAVAAVDISEARLGETRDAAGPQADRLSLHQADITDRSVVCSLPAQVEAAHGAVDLLINNAGIVQPFVPFAELDQEAIDRILNINLHGPINMTRAFLPRLAQRPEAYIANVSSMGGFVPVPGQTLYGASKAAVKLLTEGLRSELAGSTIGVSVIMPGGVATNITTNSGVVMNTNQPVDEKTAGSLTTAAEAARIILSGIERGKPRILVGRDATFMDFLSRLAPVRAARMISKSMGSLLDERFHDLARVQFKGCEADG